MRIQRVVLENCRGFERVEINLDRQFTLLAGPNGAGKTTVLDALGWVLRSMTTARAGANLARRLRTKVGDRVEETEEPASLKAWVRLEGGDSTEFQLPAEWQKAMALGSQRPFLASIDASRTRLAASDVRHGLLTEFHADWAPLLAWTAAKKQVALERFHAEAARGEAPRKLDELVPELAAAGVAVSAVISEATAFDYSFERRQLLVTLADGQLLNPAELSDGYRTLLGIVAELARRMLELHPELGARAPLETEGVILIDELDAHLHPKWQRSIVAGLMRAFPKVQFICATHSPQILAEAPQGSVVVLQPDGKVEYPTATFGRDSNSILREVLGTDERPTKLANEFAELRAAIDEGKLELARERLTQLEEELGSNVGEIVEARWALKAEEAMASDGRG